MGNADAGWAPRPVPEALLFTRSTTRTGKSVLTGHRGRTTVWLSEDGTFVKRDADGTYTIGRWTE